MSDELQYAERRACWQCGGTGRDNYLPIGPGGEPCYECDGEGELFHCPECGEQLQDELSPCEMCGWRMDNDEDETNNTGSAGEVEEQK